MKLTYEIKELENQSMQIGVSSENLKNATEKEKLTAFTIKSLVDILLKKLEEKKRRGYTAKFKKENKEN